MIPFAQAIETFLTRRSEEALEQLQGVPEDDLNRWQPRLGLEDINTFYALATHIVGAGEYWVLHAAGGRPLDRDRPAEFRARGDLTTLTARFDRWLAASHEVIAALTDADLARVFERPADPRTGLAAVRQTVAECLVHAVEHTGLHLGHLQIQRQIWNAERGGSRESDDRSRQTAGVQFPPTRF